MKVARLFGPGDVRVLDEPKTEVQPGKILVKVEAVAICASDLRIYEDGHASGIVPDHPFIQGHEFSGSVAELGEGVDGPAVGAPLIIEPSWHCGQCRLCQMGLTNICRNVVFPSFPQEDGALREFINVPPFAVEATSPSIDPVTRALMEPLGVGVHAVRLADMNPGDRIAILGCGAIGMCVFVVARAKGFEDIICAEPQDDRREFAAKAGARLVATDHRGLIDSLSDPVDGPDVVFECSGDNAAVQQAMELVRPGGKVVVVGIPHPDEVVIDSTVPRRKELTVFFSRRSRDTLEECVELVESGKIDLTAFPVKEFTIDQTPEAFAAAEAREPGMLRAVVRVDRG